MSDLLETPGLSLSQKGIVRSKRLNIRLDPNQYNHYWIGIAPNPR